MDVGSHPRLRLPLGVRTECPRSRQPGGPFRGHNGWERTANNRRDVTSDTHSRFRRRNGDSCGAGSAVVPEHVQNPLVAAFGARYRACSGHGAVFECVSGALGGLRQASGANCYEDFLC